MINWSVRKRRSSSCVEFSLGLTLLVKNFHDHYRVAAPALRRRTHVSAFALADDWHDPDGTPIAVCQDPGLYRVEVQRTIFRSPKVYIISKVYTTSRVYTI